MVGLVLLSLLCSYYLEIDGIFVLFKQKTAYELRISDWSSDVCSSDLVGRGARRHLRRSDPPPRAMRTTGLGGGRRRGCRARPTDSALVPERRRTDRKSVV